MALITITGTVQKPSGELFDSATINFALSDFMISSLGKIIPAQERSTAVDPVTGAFTIALESTTDAKPDDREYLVSVTGTEGGNTYSYSPGVIAIPPSPSAQYAWDLLKGVSPVITNILFDNALVTYLKSSLPVAGIPGRLIRATAGSVQSIFMDNGVAWEQVTVENIEPYFETSTINTSWVIDGSNCDYILGHTPHKWNVIAIINDTIVDCQVNPTTKTVTLSAVPQLGDTVTIRYTGVD